MTIQKESHEIRFHSFSVQWEEEEEDEAKPNDDETTNEEKFSITTLRPCGGGGFSRLGFLSGCWLLRGRTECEGTAGDLQFVF